MPRRGCRGVINKNSRSVHEYTTFAHILGTPDCRSFRAIVCQPPRFLVKYHFFVTRTL